MDFMNYEKAYKAVLETARMWLKDGCTDEEKICLESVFPELRESEDERIRKEIIALVRAHVTPNDTCLVRGGSTTREKAEAWLEKQKEQKPNIELIQRSWYMEGYHDREFGKEPKWILKTGEGGPKHELNPRYGQPLTEQRPTEEQLHNLNEAIKSFRMDGCDRIADSLHSLYNCILKTQEPKPIQTDAEKKYVRTLKSLVADFVRANNYIERGYYQQIYDWLDGRHVEQKGQRPDTRDSDDLQLLGFIYDLLNEIEWNDNWAMSKDECLRRLNNYSPQKPAEWNEEDERIRKAILGFLNPDKGGTKYSSNAELVEWSNWLKSLRSRPKSSDNWKPSEDQMDVLLNTESMIMASGYPENAKVLASLYKQLKKLNHDNDR